MDATVPGPHMKDSLRTTRDRNTWPMPSSNDWGISPQKARCAPLLTIDATCYTDTPLRSKEVILVSKAIRRGTCATGLGLRRSYLLPRSLSLIVFPGATTAPIILVLFSSGERQGEIERSSFIDLISTNLGAAQNFLRRYSRDECVIWFRLSRT